MGPLISYWILTRQGTVISRTAVQHVTHLESQALDNKEVFHLLDAAIAGHFTEEIFDTKGAKTNPESWAEIIGDDPDSAEEFHIIINDKDIPEADDNYDPDICEDTYDNMELAIDQGEDGPAFACVTKRLKDAEGRPIGVANDNPILYTRMHEVKYAESYKTSLASDTIANNLFAQVDAEGNRHVIFDKIMDHRTNGE